MKIARRCVACDGANLDSEPAILMPFIAARVFGWEPIEIRPEWGFRDIPAGHACSICRSAMCRDCGMLFLDMRFDGDEMAALYDDYRGEAYTTLRERFEPGYAARNAIYLDGSEYLARVEAILEPYVPRALSVLDWGGDNGMNTPFRKTARLHHVYDISGRDVIGGAVSVGVAEIEAHAYDLIAYMHVLEHVPSPRDSLAEIVTAMKPQTFLYVELPYEEIVRLTGAPHERLGRKRHWHEHINFFTPEALDALFRDSELEIIHRVTHPVTAGGKEGHVFSVLAVRAP